MLINSNGNQVVSRDRQLHETTGLTQFLGFIRQTADASPNPRGVFENGEAAIQRSSVKRESEI
jgi:hypothetical protein